MKDLILVIVQHLVAHPEAVEVTETTSEGSSLFELRVAKEDVGRVIGKQGTTANSLRTILNAVATRTNRRFRLEVVDSQRVSSEAVRNRRIPG